MAMAIAKDQLTVPSWQQSSTPGLGWLFALQCDGCMAITFVALLSEVTHCLWFPI